MGLFDFLKKGMAGGGTGAGGSDGNAAAIKKADINEAQEFLAADPTAVLIDVREPEEYMDGHVPGSMNVPVRDLAMAVSAFPDRALPIAVYCRSGVRSRRAAELLQGLGFTNITDLGGILAYKGELET